MAKIKLITGEEIWTHPRDLTFHQAFSQFIGDVKSLWIPVKPKEGVKKHYVNCDHVVEWVDYAQDGSQV